MSELILASLPAYVGPGAGLGLLGALLAVAGALFAALFFVALWPVRMLLRKMKAGARAGAPEQFGDGRTAT